MSGNAEIRDGMVSFGYSTEYYQAVLYSGILAGLAPHIQALKSCEDR
jgi:hypothetical protein